MPLKITFASINCVLFLLLSGFARAEELAIKFQTDPASSALRPFSDVVNFSLIVTGAGGKPLERGEVAIVLDAPRPARFLSTDFPMVEGTRLVEARLPINQGRAEWKQHLPIRGVYRLSVDVTAGDAQPTRQNFELSVPENPAKWLWLGLFCAGLFFVGVVAGRIFTGPRAERAALVVALALIAASGTAHEAAKQENASGPLEVEPATVGKLTSIRWRGPAGGKERALLSLSIVHLEKDKTVLEFDKLAVEKEFAFKFHFPDGAQYLVKTIAETPGRAAERAEQKVSVTGVEPPLAAQLPSLAMFVGAIAVGLGVGRFSKRR
ncbi:MAG: hypothetical protein FJ143_04465 [Deltaproteobacteria bacterium]|nr:hypothetical protein [Deltaproteobacteria bacterium]